MHSFLERWNGLDPDIAASEVLPCCGSTAWAAELAARRPIADEDHLLVTSDAVWFGLPHAAWREAFDSHPRIGQHQAKAATETSLAWSANEQGSALSAGAQDKLALAEGNRLYEEKFGRIFIVCASGKSSEDILAILQLRMNNDPVTELHASAEQQREITQLRLQRWLEGR